MSRGRFIAFEGIDGSGKTTQARRIAEEYSALFTFEPGDSDLGTILRAALLDASLPMGTTTEALLMLADRSHHVASVIEPALASGRHVVSDRYLASTLAYQGFGRGVDLEQLVAATQLATGGLVADLTVLIDVPVALAHERRARNADDRFEAAGAKFQEQVRQGFLELARDAKSRWVVVDGSRSLDDVTHDVNEAIGALFDA